MSEAGERSEPRPEGRVAERPTSGRQTDAAQAHGTGGGRNERAGTTLTLLSRAYCHLCDEMLAAIQPLAAAAGATIGVVDVDADPELERAYGDRVPVLFVGVPGTGEELCHFRVDVRRVAAALDGRAAHATRLPLRP